jgi:N-methylhydantoinase A
MSRYCLAVDVGGTFTDFVLYDKEVRALQILKVPTTPRDQSIAFIEGIEQLAAPLREFVLIAHGTTTGTNALIERRGANTALLATEGFRDLLEIRRANRQELYDCQWLPPPPLIPRYNRFEIRERLYWDGTEYTPLDEEQALDVIETLRVRGIESVAIAFIHAFADNRHELRCKELIKEALPGVYVCTSGEISQEIREFERTSTASANAFIGPIMDRYLANLELALQERGYDRDVIVMQSTGGVCTSQEARSVPAKTLRSGPAGGAMALAGLSELIGIRNLVGIDIGGTSADVSLLWDGKPRWTSPLSVEWGLPILFPSVDIVSIGAGGGSIAWIDPAGAPHVGPQSAGAEPGPACYGLGGTEPTSTDAQLVLGRLSPQAFAGGAMTVHPELAHKAIESQIAQPLVMTVSEAASGILDIMNNNMLQAIRFVTVEKGYDPRDFALVGFGGGGPMHVAELAKNLGMTRAIVPVSPGVFSAWGLLLVDLLHDATKTVLKRRSGLSLEELDGVFANLRSSVYESFSREGISPDDVDVEHYLDLQYYGQVYSLSIPLGDLASRVDSERQQDIRIAEDGLISVPLVMDKNLGFRFTEQVMDAAVDVFHKEHLREYGHSDPQMDIQIVHARVFGRSPVEKPEMRALPPRSRIKLDKALKEVRPAYFGGEMADTKVFDRSLLQRGHRIAGPAILEGSDSTVLIPPGMSASIDESFSVIIEVA